MKDTVTGSTDDVIVIDGDDVEVTLDAFPSTTSDVPDYYSVEQ